MATGVPFWMLALGSAAALVLVLVGLERWRPWRQEIGENADGLTAPAAGAVPAE